MQNMLKFYMYSQSNSANPGVMRLTPNTCTEKKRIIQKNGYVSSTPKVICMQCKYFI